MKKYKCDLGYDHRVLKSAKGEALADEKKYMKRWKAEDTHATNKTLTKIRIEK